MMRTTMRPLLMIRMIMGRRCHLVGDLRDRLADLLQLVLQAAGLLHGGIAGLAQEGTQLIREHAAVCRRGSGLPCPPIGHRLHYAPLITPPPPPHAPPAPPPPSPRPPPYPPP